MATTSPGPATTQHWVIGGGGGSALDHLLGPITVEEFMARHYEREPVVALREGAEPERFEHLLSPRDVEAMMTRAELSPGMVRVVKDAEDRSVKSRDRIRPDLAAKAWRDGASIVPNQLQTWWDPLKRFCRRLSADLGEAVQANAYYTPAGATAFKAHFDTHDVIMVQTAGRKRWRIYEPLVELPSEGQHDKLEHDDPGELWREIELQAGDAIYLPRGWPHSADDTEVDSLHVTIGINEYTWAKAIRDATAEAEREDGAFRHTATGDPEAVTAIGERLAALLTPEAILGRKHRWIAEQQTVIRDDAFDQGRSLDGLAVDTHVRRRETVLAFAEENDDGLILRFDAKEMKLPPRLGADLRKLLASDEAWTAADIPGERSNEARVKAVRTLLAEGFLDHADG